MRSITVERFSQLPDVGRPCELNRGHIVEYDFHGCRHGQVCAQITFLLGHFNETAILGNIISVGSGLITRRNPDSVRSPDIAFFSFDRLPAGKATNEWNEIAPELIFEVLSPSDRWSDLHIKIGEYLHAGVKTVCIVDDANRSIHLFHADRPSSALTDKDEFALPEILPGLQIKVARFFE